METAGEEPQRGLVVLKLGPSHSDRQDKALSPTTAFTDKIRLGIRDIFFFQKTASAISD